MEADKKIYPLDRWRRHRWHGPIAFDAFSEGGKSRRIAVFHWLMVMHDAMDWPYGWNVSQCSSAAANWKTN